MLRWDKLIFDLCPGNIGALIKGGINRCTEGGAKNPLQVGHFAFSQSILVLDFTVYLCYYPGAGFELPEAEKKRFLIYMIFYAKCLSCNVFFALRSTQLIQNVKYNAKTLQTLRIFSF